MRILTFAISAISFLSVSTLSIAQECSHVAGSDWLVTSAGQTADMEVFQVGNNITGKAHPTDCSADWEIEGTFDPSNGEFSMTVTNPIQPDYLYWCAPWVRLEGDVDEPGCDQVSDMELINPLDTYPASMEKSCDLPQGGETSTPIGWSTEPGWNTSLVFYVTLNGSGNSYKGREHRQDDWTSYPAYDQCWPPGSPNSWISLHSPERVITLNPWSYDYADTVGRGEMEVNAIRNSGISLPCGNEFGVRYSLYCSVPFPGYDHYEETTLSSGVSNVAIGVVRDSMGASKLWP